METLTINQALIKFYDINHFSEDGGINEPTAKVELFKGISIYIPNPEARRKVLLKHDVHHMLGGFLTTMKGEAAISAWEISTGCRKYWFAFLLIPWG